MKNTNSIAQKIQDNAELAEKIHAAAQHLTQLIHEARDGKMHVALEQSDGYSASNGQKIVAKITATVRFDGDGASLA
jgi:hypothetical protein